jgi:hypothetical protein
MKLIFAPLALVATLVTAQGVTQLITPSAPAPAGCLASYNGQFAFTVVNSTAPAKRSIQKVRSTRCYITFMCLQRLTRIYLFIIPFNSSSERSIYLCYVYLPRSTN